MLIHRPKGRFNFDLHNMANRLIQYLKDTRGELKHVSWPTQKQTLIFTVLVIILSLLIAGYLGVFDYIFTTALNAVI